MRVHIRLTEEASQDKQASLSILTSDLNLTNLNKKRFDKYFLISVDLPDNLLEQAKNHDLILSIEQDSLKETQ